MWISFYVRNTIQNEIKKVIKKSLFCSILVQRPSVFKRILVFPIMNNSWKFLLCHNRKSFSVDIFYYVKEIYLGFWVVEIKLRNCCSLFSEPVFMRNKSSLWDIIALFIWLTDVCFFKYAHEDVYVCWGAFCSHCTSFYL